MTAPNTPVVNPVSHFDPRLGVTFSWVYSDPVSDPQAAFQLQVIETATSSVIVDSGVVSGSQDYYALAGSVLPATSAAYTVQVKVRNLAGGLWSSYSTPVAFNTVVPAATNAPVVAPIADFDPAVGTTITWTFSDPTGRVQYQYQVDLFQTGSAQPVPVYSSGIVTSATHSFVLPGGVLPLVWQEYFAVVHVYLADGTVSPASNEPVFLTESAVPPLAPAVNPIGMLPLTGAQISWIFRDQDAIGTPHGDPAVAQTAYQVVISTVAGPSVILDTGKVVSSDQFYDVPNGTTSVGGTYIVQVRTWDNTDLVGPYSVPLTTTATADGPGLTIITPTPAEVITVPTVRLVADFVPSTGSTVASIHVTLKNHLNVVVWDGGVVQNSTLRDPGIVSSHTIDFTIGYTLLTGESYTITVVIVDSNAVSGTFTVSFTTLFAAGSGPMIVATPDAVAGVIHLLITT